MVGKIYKPRPLAVAPNRSLHCMQVYPLPLWKPYNILGRERLADPRGIIEGRPESDAGVALPAEIFAERNS